MNIGETGLKLVRLLDVTPPEAYKALTDPATMKKWFAPRSFKVDQASTDPKPDGKWRICMISPSGDRHCTSGSYIEVNEPTLLRFSFAWDGQDGALGHVSEITVNIDEFHGKSLMTFTHQGFENEQSRNEHEEGWCTCLEKLAELF